MEYHYSRLKYQHLKLDTIRTGIYPEYGGNIETDLFSFFEICYHLKDWIKESDTYEKFSDVEVFIDNSPALRISADICNRLKHKVLRDNKKKSIVANKRSHAPIGPFMLSATMTVGPAPSMARVSLSKATIQTERGEECCFALAKECMDEWARYFSEKSAVYPPKN